MTPSISQHLESRQQQFFLVLITSAYITAIGFGFYYYFTIGTGILFYNCVAAFSIHLFLGVFSFFTTKLILVFRAAILTAAAAFYVQVFYSGGALSPSLVQFIIPPLLAFFYRPVKDRYYFMVLCGLAMISLWVLTIKGYTENHLPEEYSIGTSMIVVLFVYIITIIYSFLYRAALAKKNRKLFESLEELKRTTQKLVQSEKMASLGVMSAGVAHEINNPLNFIKGGVDVLDQKLDGLNEYQPYIKAIKEGVKRASSIVHSMGHFSRSTSSMEEECDIHEIIDNCLVMLQHRIKYKVDVTKNYSSSRHIKIIGNEGKLHQAILNILSNAEQAIREKGEIIIKTRAKTNHIIVTISDSGIGISQENLQKISDPFFTTKPLGEGTGLGLAITYKIISEHGGKISVSSTIQKGTDFTIAFPLNERFK